MKALRIIAAAVLLCAGAAQAEVTGAQFLEVVKESKAAAGLYIVGFINGWQIRGLVDEVAMEDLGLNGKQWAESARRTGRTFCVPDGIKAAQIVDAAVMGLEKIPAAQKEDVDLFLYQMLLKAFPCYNPKLKPTGGDI